MKKCKKFFFLQQLQNLKSRQKGAICRSTCDVDIFIRRKASAAEGVPPIRNYFYCARNCFGVSRSVRQGDFFGTIATICKTTRCRKHFFLSSAALARPCTQPCRPCWQRRSPFLCSDDRNAGASTVTGVCQKTLARRPSTGNVVTLHGRLPACPAARKRPLLASCMKHTPRRVAQPRCNERLTWLAASK